MSSGTGDDPRDPSQETTFTFPETWRTEASDGLAASVMFISGLIMVTRNRFIAWPALFISINSAINQHPLRTKEGGNSLSTLVLAASALVASYIPLLVLPNSGPSQTPLPTV